MSVGLGRAAWVFDLDGTLTVAVHDFAAMRRELGFPPDLNLLEGLAGLAPDARATAEARIRQWEWDHAELAQAGPGVRDLLEDLAQAGIRLGVLTRNLAPIAHRTLAVAGLDHLFAPDDVLGRTCAAPKPAPDGLTVLLDRWGCPADDAVMVGDYVHDMQAGRAAGTTTVLLRSALPEAWRPFVDHHHVDATTLHAAWRA